MKLEQILNYVINALFFFLGNKIKGFRTIIVNALTLLIGLWEFATNGNGLFEFLCRIGETWQPLAFFCNITEGAFYAVMLTIVAALNNILRLVTGAPVGVSTDPAELTYEMAKPTTGQRVAQGVGACSVITIIIGIIKMIFF